jgi:chromate transport protein ChrA
VLIYGRAAVTDVWTAVIAVAAFVIFILSRDRVHPVLLILLGGVVGVFIY